MNILGSVALDDVNPGTQGMRTGTMSPLPSDQPSCSMTSTNQNPPPPSHTQTVKPRSRRWKDTAPPARRSGASASIWSRGYTAGCTTTKKEEEEEEEEERPRPLSTRGQERVVGLQGLRLASRQPAVKRPREGESPSGSLERHRLSRLVLDGSMLSS